MKEPTDDLVVLRCEACGNTFTLHAGDEFRCNLCGSEKVHLTHEPLL